MMRWMIFLAAIMGYANEVKICVSIVVENDEHQIAQCLESIKGLADFIILYDIGSTDQTIGIAKKFLTEAKIPGIIQKHDVKNRNHPRNIAMALAEKVIKNDKVSSNSTYILSLDPGMVLKTDPNFSKNALVADAYSLLEKNAQFGSYEIHLFHSQLLWESVGSARPFWSCTSPHKTEKIKTLTIETQVDLQKESEQLADELKKEPDNGHNLFYLALNYQGLKRLPQAIELYRQRLDKWGDLEECWFSKYMIGECYEGLDKWDEALYWYLEAYQANPSRAEPLKNISTHYRVLGRNDLAYIFAKFGSRIPLTDDQTHFSNHPLAKYQFDEELSIVSFYTQFKDDGYQAASDLLLKKNIPYSIREQTYRNLLYYVEPLKGASYQPIEIDLPFAREGIRNNPMNPSIVKTSQGYSVICRTINYTQTGAKNFHSHDDNGIFRTRNFLVQYDRGFSLLSQKEIVEELPRERIGMPLVQGLEDCRLFEYNQQFWCTCTTTDTNPTGSYQISLCKLGVEKGLDYVPVETLVPLNGPDPRRCEKNWLPFVHGGQFLAIYSYDPFVIFAPDPETGQCESVFRYEPENDFSYLRGSAGPLPFDGGYLILVHEVVFQANGERAYLHRFLFLDRDFVIVQTSRPFIFKHTGVEYCCSMTLDHTGDKIILPIGIEDREAHLCTVDCETVRSLLSPLPKNGL